MTGDVTNFQTPHSANNWHVKLTADGDDTANLPDATIMQTGTSGAGTWEHKRLARHANAFAANVADGFYPIAFTG